MNLENHHFKGIKVNVVPKWIWLSHCVTISYIPTLLLISFAWTENSENAVSACSPCTFEPIPFPDGPNKLGSLNTPLYKKAASKADNSSTDDNLKQAYARTEPVARKNSSFVSHTNLTKTVLSCTNNIQQSLEYMLQALQVCNYGYISRWLY